MELKGVESAGGEKGGWGRAGAKYHDDVEEEEIESIDGTLSLYIYKYM